MTKPTPVSDTTAFIIDSQQSSFAGNVKCLTGGLSPYGRMMMSESRITAGRFGCATAPFSFWFPKDAFSSHAFIRQSQRADLSYLKRLKEGKYEELGCQRVMYTGMNTGIAAGSSSPVISPFSTICTPRTPEKLARVSTEYDLSRPKDADEQSAVCETGTVWWDDVGSGVGGCMERNVVAVADYTAGDQKMYFRNGTSLAPTNFTQPLTTGKYIEYSTGQLLSRLTTFSGKKMKIEWSGTIPTTGQRTLFSFKSNGC